MIKKHVGKMANTDQRLVVVLMQIPQRETHALAIAADNLPPYIEQAVMSIVDSQEGQAAVNLLEVLGRRLMSDSGKSVLQTLHELQLLQPVPVEKVIMLPQPNMPFPLKSIIEAMGGAVPASGPTPTTPTAETEKFNAHVQNQTAQSVEEKVGIARSLLVEAMDLEAIASKKREQAYSMAPSLRPTPVEVAAPAPAQVDVVAVEKSIVGEAAGGGNEAAAGA